MSIVRRAASVPMGAVVGAALYVLMFLFALLDLAFSPLAWERPLGGALLTMLALLPAFLVAGAVGAWLQRVGARIVRYALVGAAYGGPVAAFFRAAMPLTATYYDPESPYRLSMAESALYGAAAFFLGGLLLAIIAAFRRSSDD
jgi:hypothetical protein